MYYQPRVAFVPDGPFIVAAREFVYAGRSYAKGASFDSTGVDRFQQFEMWNALQLDVAPRLEPAKPGTMHTATVSASESATIQTPSVASEQSAQAVDRKDRKHKRRW